MISSEGAQAIRYGAWATRVHMWHAEAGAAVEPHTGRQKEREVEVEREREKVFAGIITPHERRARHRRLSYARSGPRAHSLNTHRSSFSSSPLSAPGFASVLTLRVRSSKEALGTSPAFSPAAVKTLSSLFLPPDLNILLGKDGVADAMDIFFIYIYIFLRLHRARPDVT